MIFKDRKEAGKMLVGKLEKYKNDKNAVVLGLPRGGVVNAFEVADGLNLPLDVAIVRKIGAPNRPELAAGAIAEGGHIFLNEEILASYGISVNDLNESIEEKEKEISHRSNIFRENRDPIDLNNKIVILVDDGVATGATVRAAIKSVKSQNPKKVVLATPVIPKDVLETMKKEVDEVVYLDAPQFFMAVGSFYEIFNQVENEEVVEILKKSRSLN